MLTTLRHMMSRVGPWPRRAAAAACLVLAAASALGASGPHPGGAAGSGDSMRLVVAARDVPVGHVLTRRDVAVRWWPRALAPPGAVPATSVASVTGRRSAGPIGAGEPLTPRRLIGRDLTSGLGASDVLAAVPVDDPHVGDLVHAGDSIDVLATPQQDPSGSGRQGVTTVAEGARVLVVLAGGGDDTASGGADVVIATDRDAATRLAGVSSSEVFTIVGRSP